MLRFLLIVACVLAAFLPAGGPAWAHAILVDTQPADGASLSVAPSEIVLRFNEPVSPVALRVLDAGGGDRAAALPRSQDNEIRLALPALPDGGYIVSWRVVSADSHPIGGGFVFTIGTGASPGAYTPDDARREAAWTAFVIADRLILYIALMFASGGTLFSFFVLRPLRVEVAAFATWRRRAAVLALAAAILAIGLKGGQLGALPASGLIDPAAWTLGLATSTARSAAIIVAGLLMLLVAARAGRARAWLEAGGALVALAGLSATGHAATGARWLQALAVLHALCAGFWLGAFWPLLRLMPAHPAAMLAAARRFSSLAMPAVLVLAASGVIMALTRLGEWSDLVVSAYGQLLLCKLLFVGPLLIVAAANRWQATPAFVAGRHHASSDLARNVRLEIALGFLVLALTALLAHTPPPGVAIDHDHARAMTGHTVWASQRNRTLLLEVTPAAPGANAVTARFATEAGETLAPLEARVSFARPEAGIEPITRPLARGADGVFRLERIDLNLPGAWNVRVEALIDDFERAAFETEIPLSAATRPR